MKRGITFLLMGSLALPGIVGGLSVSSSASTKSGGVTAGEGETVVTESSHASAHIQTTIISNAGTSSGATVITVEENGVKTTATTHYNDPESGDKSSDIRAVSVTKKAKTGTRAHNGTSSLPTSPVYRYSSSTPHVQYRVMILRHVPSSVRSIAQHIMNFFLGVQIGT
jgi:hypothetical protein